MTRTTRMMSNKNSIKFNFFRDGEVEQDKEQREEPPKTHNGEDEADDDTQGEEPPRKASEGEKSKELLELENRARYEKNDLVNFELVVECEPRHKNELNNSNFLKIKVSK